ncbi:unnamed protein product [Linum trigynum]|uniref:Uncharacterized protein n=1 Tax=Linum trigynum TaxID=586398 RepID=A0AAV2F688_9ROSI
MGKGDCFTARFLQDGASYQRPVDNGEFPREGVVEGSGVATDCKPDISYAEVVKRGEFYGVGRCVVRTNRHGRYIDVGSEGVAERLSLLGRSLVITKNSVAEF